MLGQDALGKLALGQLYSSGAVILVVAGGSYTVTGNAATFSVQLVGTTQSYIVTGNAATFSTRLAASGASYTITGSAVALNSSLNAVSGSYTVTGSSVTTQQVWSGLGSASYSITVGDAILTRTGGNYDQVYGGVGHYLEELQRLRDLAAITRKTPQPIVRPRSPIRMGFDRPQAPAAPVIDLQALQAQAQAQAAAQQAARRKRQDAEILLLLAS